MGGIKIIAASSVILFGSLGTPAVADSDAVVVSLKQPAGVVGYNCECKSCEMGMLCGGNACENHANQEQQTPWNNGPVMKPVSVHLEVRDDLVKPVSAVLATNTTEEAKSTGSAAAYVDFDALGSDGLLSDIPSTSSVSSTQWLADVGVSPDGVTPVVCWVDGACDAMGCDTAGCDQAGCDAGLCGCKRADCLSYDLCKRQGWWIRTEAILWWGANNSVPPLATSSPIGTPFDQIGVIGLPSTTVLSSDSLFDDMRAGGRVRFGKWAHCGIGFDSSIWLLGNLTDEESWQSTGDPGLAVPFTNVDPLNPGPDSEVVAGFDPILANNILAGTLTINSSSEIYGGDAGIRKQIYCCSNDCSKYSYRVDCYAGYRYFRVREGLRISESLESTSLVGPTVLGTTIDLYDDFRTQNEFHGANFGTVVMTQRGRWSTELVSRIALGNVDREVRIDGQTTVNVPTVAPDVRPGGIFTQTSNIGVYQDDDFAVLPEIQLNVGYTVSNHTRLTAGYTFMYLGNIVRPGDVIDTNVNGLYLDNSLPFNGPERPRFAWNDSTMWLMGLSVGAEFTF